MSDTMILRDEIMNMLEEVKNYRRALHKIPETGEDPAGRLCHLRRFFAD